MKKYFCVIVAFLLIVSLCSCSERKLTADEKEKLSKIYELGEGYDGSEEWTLENIVYREPVFSSDSSVALKTKLLIGSVEKELVYQDTLYYPVGGETVHRYFESGVEDRTVLLYPDGSVKALLYSFAFLEISETPTVDEILPLLEAELNHWVDLSAYAHRELPKENPSKSSNIYDFLYYNSVEGYMTNWMRVSVGKDGKVFGFAVYNLDCEVDALPLSCIDKETETELQKLKLQDIYASSISPSAFESYETHYSPEIVLFDDQPYVLYYVSATYAYYGSSMHTFMHEILVPLELLIPANT